MSDTARPLRNHKVQSDLSLISVSSRAGRDGNSECAENLSAETQTLFECRPFATRIPEVAEILPDCSPPSRERVECGVYRAAIGFIP